MHYFQSMGTRAQTNVGTFEFSFIYVTFVSRFFAPKHLLIVLMPDLCANFVQSHFIAVSQ